MKIHILLLSCLCSSLAITVHHDAHPKNTKEYKTALKDIRLVPVTEQPELIQPTEDIKLVQKPREEPKNRRHSPKPRGDKKKFPSPTARIGNAQNYQNDPTHQYYMQKMANQLYVAQKHASLLSDYQKFILNQDENVKKFVLAQSTQDRNPKPFARHRQTGRALQLPKAKYTPDTQKLQYVSTEPVTAATVDYKKIVVVTPKVQTTAQIIPKPQSDHSAQATQIKYVTLAPQLTQFVETHEPSPKVTLVPYHAPQQYAYYDLGVTHKPVEVPTTVSLGLGAYESPKYYEGRHDEEDVHHNSNYEFMYNVKDHEKQSNFGHKESRTDKMTYGFYFVHLPDGRLETVKYWADKTGYHAKVDYQGEAKHPSMAELKFHGQNFLHH